MVKEIFEFLFFITGIICFLLVIGILLKVGYHLFFDGGDL